MRCRNGENRPEAAIAELSFSGTVVQDQSTLDPFGAAVEVGDNVVFRISLDLTTPVGGFDIVPFIPGATGSAFQYGLANRGNMRVEIGSVTFDCNLTLLFVVDDFASPLAPSPTDFWNVAATDGFGSDPGGDCVNLAFGLRLTGSDTFTLADATFFLPDTLAGFVPSFSAGQIVVDPSANTVRTVEVANGSIDAINDIDRDGELDANDNCPTVSNADQADGDGDGDACVPFRTIPGNATVGTNPEIGENTDIDQAVVIGNDAEIGDNVDIDRDANIGDDATIGDGVNIDRDASIGDRVTIGANTIIRRGVEIGDDVTIGQSTVINRNARICAGVTIRDFVTIGKNALVSENVADSTVIAGSNVLPGGCP